MCHHRSKLILKTVSTKLTKHFNIFATFKCFIIIFNFTGSYVKFLKELYVNSDKRKIYFLEIIIKIRNWFKSLRNVQSPQVYFCRMKLLLLFIWPLTDFLPLAFIFCYFNAFSLSQSWNRFSFEKRYWASQKLCNLTLRERATCKRVMNLRLR